MNRLSLLQEIEVKSGSSGEESGAYDYRRVPTDTTARSDDDDANDDSASAALHGPGAVEAGAGR